MTERKRMRGDKLSYPICVWNGIFDHYGKIGIAIWEFLWLIDAITEEQDGIGWVYGKTPFKIEKIANDLGIGRSTARRNLERLKDGGYIVTRKARYGLVVGVINSRKIRPRARLADLSEVSGLDSRPLKSEHSECSEVSTLSTKSEHSGDSILMDNAVRQSSRTAAPLPASELWNLIEVSPRRVPPAFRELCEGLYVTRNGQPLSDFMGVCMDAWSAMGEKRYPPEFAKAKAKIRAGEKEKASSGATLPYLEPMPPIPCKSR